MRARAAALSLVLVGACGPGSSDDEQGESETDGSEGDPLPDPSWCQAVDEPAAAPGEQALELVALRADIPGLAAQPTARGQVLGALFAFDGRVHLGYGDYSDNTGPILSVAWNDELGRFDALGVLPTEEVQAFRPGLAELYVPAIDPDGHQESGGVYRLDCASSSWVIGTPIEGAVHVYDVARQGESIYAGTGSLTGAPALLVRSDDRGDSWTEVLRRESADDRFSRFYTLGATSDVLFAWGEDSPAPHQPYAYVRHGEGEFEAMAMPTANPLYPIVLADAMVLAEFTGTPGRSSYIATHRIEGSGLVEIEPWPTLASGSAVPLTWTYEGESLVVLLREDDGSLAVQRTADLGLGSDGFESLATIDPLPADAMGVVESFVSAAALHGDLYLGSSLGSLYVLRELDPA
jgi:hypothetical protein